MDLHTISYTSASVHTPTAAQLERLLRKARQRNAQEGVTGVLLYADGTFHQYLEGPSHGLGRVYTAILGDQSHHHVFEMIREPIEAREFSNWSMGYRGTEAFENDAADADLLALLADPSSRLTPGRLLLNAFWSKGLGLRYLAALRAGRPQHATG